MNSLNHKPHEQHERSHPAPRLFRRSRDQALAFNFNTKDTKSTKALVSLVSFVVELREAVSNAGFAGKPFVPFVVESFLRKPAVCS